jgi:hypothetical protein
MVVSSWCSRGALAACTTNASKIGWACSRNGASSFHWVEAGSGTPRLCWNRSSR